MRDNERKKLWENRKTNLRYYISHSKQLIHVCLFFSFCMLRRKYSMKGSKKVLKYVRMLGNVPIDVLL